MKLDLSTRNKAKIERKIMEMNKAGWPKVYEPSEDHCLRCLSPLQAPKQHAVLRPAYQGQLHQRDCVGEEVPQLKIMNQMMKISIPKILSQLDKKKECFV